MIYSLYIHTYLHSYIHTYIILKLQERGQVNYTSESQVHKLCVFGLLRQEIRQWDIRIKKRMLFRGIVILFIVIWSKDSIEKRFCNATGTGASSVSSNKCISSLLRLQCDRPSECILILDFSHSNLAMVNIMYTTGQRARRKVIVANMEYSIDTLLATVFICR